MFDWILANWPLVLEKAFVVIGVASAVVKGLGALNARWTWDDKASAFIDKVLSFLGRVALNTSEPKARLPKP